MKDVLGRVGILGLGAAPMGNLFHAVDDAECEAVFDAMWDVGVRYFDTAPHYGLGLSERRLGRSLSSRPREEYVLSTKVGRLLVPTPDRAGLQDDEGFAVPAAWGRRWDFSAAGVQESLTRSLERLGTERVDIVFLHDPDDHLEQAIDEALPALEELKHAGVIQAIGVGSKNTTTITRLIETGRLDVAMVAGRYTLLDQSAAQDVLPAAARHGVALVAVGVYNSGILARPEPGPDSTFEYGPAPAEIVARAQAIARVCARFGVELPHAAVQFPLRHRGVTNVTVGIGKLAHVPSTRRWIDEPVPDPLWGALIAEGLLAGEPA